jgi:hypothetical protein
MATLMDLERAGRLQKYDPDLSWREQEYRCVYLLPSAVAWMRDKLPLEISDLRLERTPEEQVFTFLENFCAGHELWFPRQLHSLRHVDSGVWELKTADVRLFGWFPIRDHFVCSNGDMATRVKDGHLYERYRDEAVQMRDALNLDSPKFIAGGDPDDVVSAFSAG